MAPGTPCELCIFFVNKGLFVWTNVPFYAILNMIHYLYYQQDFAPRKTLAPPRPAGKPKSNKNGRRRPPAKALFRIEWQEGAPIKNTRAFDTESEEIHALSAV